MILCLLICITSLDVFAQQEVRGIETRRVTLENGYGWEFYNRNKVAVSIDIEIWWWYYNNAGYTYDPNSRIVETKSIILAPEEKYTYLYKNMTDYNQSDNKKYYYVKYKAYKLLE